MKRILIFTPSFEIGGTNSSLLAFLSQVDSAVLDVDVFALKKDGYYKSVLPKCRILGENIWISRIIIEGGIIKRNLNLFFRAIRKIFNYIGIDITSLYIRLAGITLRTRSYDAVISFQENLSDILSRLPSKKRIAWIRSEYSRYYELNKKKDETDIYKRIHVVVCVSDFAKNSFLKFFPTIGNKVVVIHNFMDVDGIRERAKESILFHKDFDNSVFTIISIGRIDRVKQFEMIPLIAKEIKCLTDKPFKWYIIGGSSGDFYLDNMIINRIVENQLEKTVFLLGEITNINPYLQQSNLFVHTSKSETFSRVVNEAKILCVPSVINDYDCSYEFVKDGYDGIIVNNAKMAGVIAGLIENHSLLYEIKRNLQVQHYDNLALMSQFYRLLDL